MLDSLWIDICRDFIMIAKHRNHDDSSDSSLVVLLHLQLTAWHSLTTCCSVAKLCIEESASVKGPARPAAGVRAADRAPWWFRFSPFPHCQISFLFFTMKMGESISRYKSLIKTVWLESQCLQSSSGFPSMPAKFSWVPQNLAWQNIKNFKTSRTWQLELCRHWDSSWKVLIKW